jgi:stage II sporulation SpoE-like protein
MREGRHALAYPHRRRLLAAVAAACATISLACIPAATARSGPGITRPPAAAQSGAPVQVAPNAAQLEATVESVPVATVTTVTTAKRAKPTKPSTTSVKSPATLATPSAPTAKPTKHQKHVEGAPSEPRRLQERAGKVSVAHVSPALAKQLEASRSLLKGSGTGASGSTPTQAPAPVASPAATAATVTPSPPAAVSVPAASAAPTTLSAPASKPAAHHAARRGHRRSRTATSARGASRAATPAAVARLAGSAASSDGAGASNRLQSTRRSGQRAASPGIVAPLATTITKIVDVVPTPVRALIGALLALALALAVRSRFAARRARRLEQQRSQLLEDVGLLQAALLPVPPARLGPVGTTAAYRPAAGPAAGGDFYDVFALEDGQLGVIVGDVSGHGRKALPHTALVRFTLRAYLEAGLSPREAVRTAGSVLERQLDGSFVTVVAATYNPRTRVLVYASAGHPPPVVLGADDAPLSPVTVSSAPPIGVGLPTGTRQSIVSVPGRARICFHTDGVTEARVAHELFGDRRLADALVELGPQASASELLDRVADEADSRPDDMAACLLGVEGGTQPPRALREELELDRETAASERTEQFLLACGLPAGEVPAVMHVLAAAVAREGSAVLEVHDEDGRARARLQHDNLTYLQTRHDARQAVVGASR